MFRMMGTAMVELTASWPRMRLEMLTLIVVRSTFASVGSLTEQTNKVRGDELVGLVAQRGNVAHARVRGLVSRGV